MWIWYGILWRIPFYACADIPSSNFIDAILEMNDYVWDSPRAYALIVCDLSKV